jgi:hypothetical protein
LLYVPLLYGAGWLLSRPLALLAPSWRPDQVDLAGAVIALVLLLFSLANRFISSQHGQLFGQFRCSERLAEQVVDRSGNGGPEALDRKPCDSVDAGLASG